MKIKDIDKYKPVKIKISNPRGYLQTAILVDSPMFLWDINEIRKDFEINHFFKYSDYSAWNEHLLRLAGLDQNKDVNTQEIQADRLNELQNEFNRRIASTRQTFGYPQRFDNLIKQAVLFNEVREIIKPAYPTLFGSHDKYNWHGKFPEINAIVFEPYATEEDIIAAFEEWKQLPEEEKARKVFERELYSDTASRVERDRNWFWQKYKEGKTYSEILNAWNKLCPYYQNHESEDSSDSCKYCGLDQNVIEQSVSAYRKRIQLLFASKS